jgi:ATP-dependent helicase/nuclease subunit A
MPAADAQPGTPDALAWVRARSTDVPATAAARERVRREAENEHRRLLYVAMTRARDRLVVCGAEGALKRQPGCWWDLVFHALRADSVEGTDDDDAGKVWSYRPASAGVGRSEPAGAATRPAADLPSWLDRDAHAEPARAPPLSPSRAYDAASTARAIGAGDQIDRAKVMARGVLMHRLLQSLPDLAPAARLEAGRRHLARNAAVLSAVEREAMLGEVLAVLEDLRFAGLFQPGSRAEVPIVGRLEYQCRNITVSGLVDRLAVLPDAVLIVDYKTNRPAPASIDDVPAAYITQLALYRAVLSQLYPDRSVRAALLFTEVPELMEIPAAALDRALTLPVTSA